MASTQPRASREKTRPSIYWLLGAIVIPGFELIVRVDIENPENLPREGAYVLAPNHMSEFDPIVVARAVWKLGRAPRFLAKESLFRVPVLGAALRAAKMIPVSRASSASGAKETIRHAEMLVEQGQGVIVYPEGTLTRDPDLWPMRGKTGAVRLALEGDVPLIPVAHWGVQQILPRYGKLNILPPRKRVRMIIGDPIDLSAYRGRQREASALAAATDELMARIAQLQGELRGQTPPAQRWDPSAHGQKETGRLES